MANNKKTNTLIFLKYISANSNDKILNIIYIFLILINCLRWVLQKMVQII